MLRKAFTLIELLVVIGIMAVIAAGVIATINPQQKLLQARDANSQNAVGQVSGALQAFAAADSGGLYPAAVANIVPSELTVLPALPTAGAWRDGAAVFAVNGTFTAASVGVNMQATKNQTAGATSTFCWRSALGTVTVMTAAACVP